MLVEEQAKSTVEIDPALYPPVKLSRAELAADHARIKQRYIQFLIGTDQTFAGKYGKEAATGFLERINGPIGKAMKFDSLSRAKALW